MKDIEKDDVVKEDEEKKRGKKKIGARDFAVAKVRSRYVLLEALQRKMEKTVLLVQRGGSTSYNFKYLPFYYY